MEQSQHTMEKSIILFVAAFCLLSCEDNDLLPSMESYNAENYRLSQILNYGSSTASHPYGTVVLKYDKTGNLIKESLFDYPGTLTLYREYEYEGDRLIEKRIYSGQVGNLRLGTYTRYAYQNGQLSQEELFSSDGTLKRTTHYEYDGEKLVNTYKVEDRFGIYGQYKYTYDNFGRLILEESFTYNQELDHFIKYSYDSMDRLIKRESFNSTGNISSTVEKKYLDANTLPFEELYYDANGVLIQRRELLYDTYGNLIETVIIDQQGSTNTLCKKKFKGKLLIEKITYIPNFGYEEWTVTRYEYEKILVAQGP